MSQPAELRLRRFLVWLVLLICGGTVVELVLVAHTASWIQWLPLVVAAVSGGAAGAVLKLGFDAGNAVTAFRFLMFGLLGLAAVGVVMHVRENYLFVREITPATAGLDALVQALSGASPLLASGILAVAGACGLAATGRS